MTTYIQPTIFFDFANTKTLDPRINFTRASTATYYDASGIMQTASAGTPRFDHKPVTGESLGLLIEEQRTNLFLRSEEFDNAAWLKDNSTIAANTTVAPNGAMTADTFTDVSGGAYSELRQQGISVVSGTSYRFSIRAKKGTRRYLYMSLATPRFPSATEAIFDLESGVVKSSGAGAIAASVTADAEGFFVCGFTATAASSGTVAAFFYHVNNAGTSVLYTGTGTGTIFLWGVQLEAGAFATSYIPTVDSTVTRNADVATITGSNFTSFWNATQGGATVQTTPSTVSGIRPLVQYDDGTTNEIIALRGNTTNPELYVVDGGTPQAQLDAGTIAANTPYSLTGWWQTNDCRARKDSGAAVTDAMATIPTVTQARIGSDGTNYLNGTIATINYYAAFSSQIYTRRKNKVVSSLF